MKNRSEGRPRQTHENKEDNLGLCFVDNLGLSYQDKAMEQLLQDGSKVK